MSDPLSSRTPAPLRFAAWERLAAMYGVDVPEAVVNAEARRKALSALGTSRLERREASHALAARLADAEDLAAEVDAITPDIIRRLVLEYVSANTDLGGVGDVRLGLALRRSTAAFREALGPKVRDDLDTLATSAKSLRGAVALDPASMLGAGGRIDVDSVAALNDAIDPLHRLETFVTTLPPVDVSFQDYGISPLVAVLLTIVKPSDKIEARTIMTGVLERPDVSSPVGQEHRHSARVFARDLNERGIAETLARTARGDYVSMTLAMVDNDLDQRVRVFARAFQTRNVPRPGSRDDVGAAAQGHAA